MTRTSTRRRDGRRQQTCRCSAYPFPHRLGGGGCVEHLTCHHGHNPVRDGGRCSRCDWEDYADVLHDRC